MGYLPDDVNAQLNQMWINVRCFNFSQVSGTVWLEPCNHLFISILIIWVKVTGFSESLSNRDIIGLIDKGCFLLI